MKAASSDFTEIHPHCEWMRVDESDALVVHVPEFKKEELKVHADTSGKLKIGGRRALEGNKWRGFLQTFQLPKECNVRMIRANFDEGKLYVVLPASGQSNGQLYHEIGEDASCPGAAAKAFRKHWKLITAAVAAAVAAAVGTYTALKMMRQGLYSSERISGF